MSEQELLEKLAKGDHSAFEKIFETFYKPLVVFALKLVNDRDLARDLVQEVIVNFYEKRKEINIHTSLKSLLYQSVRNRCLNHIKRESVIRNHHEAIYIQKMNSEKDFVDVVEETELENRIYKTISELPSQCKKIFEMSRFQGKANAEIAEELSISKRTVETQISNALKKLRIKLLANTHLINIILATISILN